MNIQDVLAAREWRAIGEQNPKIKQVRAILSNTKPNPHKLFVAEGIWILSLCEKFNAPIDCLILCPEHIRTPEAAALADKLAARTDERFTVSAKTFEKISERGQPDGLLALAGLPRHDIAAFAPGEDAVLLVLDGIEIPGNVGTMLRMADGAGVDGVFLCNRKARMTHPKLIKGSQGAVLSVPFFEFESVAACRFTEGTESGEQDSKRQEVKRLIASLRESNPYADINIFRSAYNVHVDTLIEYDSRGVRYPFLQRFAAKAPAPSQGEEPAES